MQQSSIILVLNILILILILILLILLILVLFGTFYYIRSRSEHLAAQPKAQASHEDIELALQETVSVFAPPPDHHEGNINPSQQNQAPQLESPAKPETVNNPNHNQDENADPDFPVYDNGHFKTNEISEKLQSSKDFRRQQLMRPQNSSSRMVRDPHIDYTYALADMDHESALAAMQTRQII